MKRSLLVFMISIIPLSVLSQKTAMQLTRTRDASISEWQILDDKYMQVLTGNEYPADDTITFSLEANKRYFLLISISRINYADTCLYSLWLNNEFIVLINSDAGTGDHFFPFFTGVKADLEAKITGGSNAAISDFPWQVFFEAENFTCGGSIISNQWIIIAAHCTRDDYNVKIPASSMDVVVGASNPRNSSQGKKYYVSEVISHESFDISTLENDIALLKLNEPIDYPNATPIKLVSAKDVAAGATDPGVMSWVTGYGITSVNPVIYPSALQKVQLPIVSNSQASLVWRDIPVTDIMAGYRDGNKDACSGDSGGPLVVPVVGEYKLAGLVSWGSTDCNTYGAYTRLSLFESWITQKTGIEITFVAPVPQGDSIVCSGTSYTEYQAAAVAGASAYNWSLTPQSAGTIYGNAETAIVSWNSGFTGSADVKLQVSRNGELSEKSELVVNVAKLTRLISQPADSVMCAERPIVLKVEAEGYNLNYTWYRNGNLLSSGPSGVVSILSALVEDSGQYFCEIKGSCGSVVSRTINLTVLPVTRINSITPDTEVSFGDDLTLDVTTEGHNLTYQWQKDNNPLDQGNSSNLVLQNVDANDIGLYQTTVTGTCGTVQSDKVYVYVKKEDYSGDPEVFVWPTMVTGEFSVALSNDKNYTILLHNTIGRLLKKKENCQYQTIMNISDLPSGIYIVTVYNDTMRKSIKLIKR
jgi:hypothetical protein